MDRAFVHHHAEKGPEEQSMQQGCGYLFSLLRSCFTTRQGGRMTYDQWRHFGTELRRLRRESNLSQDQLGKRVGLSHGMIGMLERAVRSPKPDYCDALDQVLETDGLLSRIWHDVNGRVDVPSWFRNALNLERQAGEIRTFESLVIPGIVQTPRYAAALDAGQRLRPEPQATEEVVKIRTGRLEAVQANDALLSFVLTETVLHNTVGGPDIMREQLGTLADIAESGQAQIQVLRRTTPLAFSYPLIIMTLRRQTVAYAEHAGGGALIDRHEDVERLAYRFARIQAEALPPGESITLIRTLEEKHAVA
jgi:transcriptional regulator with XRE-family HTH domain